jgi:hypothetical protein
MKTTDIIWTARSYSRAIANKKPLYVNRYVVQTLKLHKRYATIAATLYMSLIMSFMMSMLITAVSAGVNDHFFAQVWNAYQVSMPCAVLCTLSVRPLVTQLVRWTVQ